MKLKYFDTMKATITAGILGLILGLLISYSTIDQNKSSDIEAKYVKTIDSLKSANAEYEFQLTRIEQGIKEWKERHSSNSRRGQLRLETDSEKKRRILSKGTITQEELEWLRDIDPEHIYSTKGMNLHNQGYEMENGMRNENEIILEEK